MFSFIKTPQDEYISPNINLRTFATFLDRTIKSWQFSLGFPEVRFQVFGQSIHCPIFPRVAGSISGFDPYRDYNQLSGLSIFNLSPQN